MNLNKIQTYKYPLHELHSLWAIRCPEPDQVSGELTVSEKAVVGSFGEQGGDQVDGHGPFSQSQQLHSLPNFVIAFLYDCFHQKASTLHGGKCNNNHEHT